MPFLASTSASSPGAAFLVPAPPRLITPLCSTAVPEEPPSSSTTDKDEDAFSLLSDLSVSALLRSDMRRDAIGKGQGESAPSSATNWIDDRSAYALRQALDKIQLKPADGRAGLDRDETSAWLRWLKSSPTPLIVDLSADLRAAANATLDGNADYGMLRNVTRGSQKKLLRRLGCRLILLPSGAELRSPLLEPPSSVVFGKLLFGGATRYRLIASSTSARVARRAGERTETKRSASDNVQSWIQYGGPERKYEAVDMGPCAVLELALLPLGKEMPSVFAKQSDVAKTTNDMALGRIAWNPRNMFAFLPEEEGEEGVSGPTTVDALVAGNTPMSLSGRDRNEAFESDFRTAVGGLRPQIEAIVRRVLDGRVIRPAEIVDAERASGLNDAVDATSAELSLAASEADELALLGLTPVRGLLLYGPPGCGKTALAREISRALRARSPKIVSAPELLDRWVGGSEKLIRSLFADAEAELASVGGDASRSALHVVVIDEIDAVFRKRSSAEDSGEATRSSAVNQILAKLDGIEAIPNVLMIGMTNRRELLDEALLRPGRLEVQIEIPLPDQEGRREILRIHFDALRRRDRLSKPLCCAVDGVAGYDDADGGMEYGAAGTASGGGTGSGDDTAGPSRGRKRRAIKRAVKKVMSAAPINLTGRPAYDLSADALTGGMSGADLAGLVRCAGSIALARARRDGGGVDGLLITLDDVKEALEEVRR